MKSFSELVSEAWEAPFAGWDFSWLQGRHISLPLSWDYLALAKTHLRQSTAVLDMDTGGGELFASLAPFPPVAHATESYPPNIPLARARLEPLGVHLDAVDTSHHLPYPDAAFDLILNRHGSYPPADLFRALRPGGIFLTQQVGGKNETRLNELLQEQPHFIYAHWDLAYAQREIEAAGFSILQAREEFPQSEFRDVGAVVYYLRIISWQIEGFTPTAYSDRLRQIDALIRSEGKLVVPEHRFFIEARKPPA
jgi:SAM-dependent methyltransferase